VTDKAPPTPTTDTRELANELDDLLREVSRQAQAEAPQAPAAPPKEPDALDRQADAALADAPAGEPIGTGDDWDSDFTTPEQTLAETHDPLAEQIQEMLDEARVKQPEPAPAPAPEPAAAEGSAGEPSIEQIDAQLAADAEAEIDGLAGGFESFDQVMGTAPAASPAVGSDDEEPNAEDDASPADVLGRISATAEAESDPPDPEREGDFATAADVAAELDAQPEHAPAAHARAEPHTDDAADHAPPPRAHDRTAHAHDDDTPDAHDADVRRRIDWQAHAVVNADRLRRVCATVNRPMGKLSPEMRNTVGYIGLATLANASLLLVYRVLF